VVVKLVLYSLYRLTGVAVHCLLIIVAPVLDLVAPGLAIYSRLGRYSGGHFSGGVRIWIHAASVGEVQAARALIHGLLQRNERLEVLVTTMTRQGRAVAAEQLPAQVICETAPLDTPWAVASAVQRIKPDLYICLETELWPELLARLDREEIPRLLLNGRMSERSSKRYQLIAATMSRVLDHFAGIAVITEQDASRYRKLVSVPQQVKVCGNMKYAQSAHNPAKARAKYTQLLDVGTSSVFICGSTRTGEEKLLVPVYKALVSQAAYPVIWIIAPRHLDRLSQVEKLLQDSELGYTLFSKCCSSGRTENIVVVDEMGKLAQLYAVGDYIFCGGSLVARGGHNIMEPVQMEKPVFFGPWMDDFSDAVELVLKAGAGFQVESAAELAEKLVSFVDTTNSADYQQAVTCAKQLALNQQSAVDSQVALVMDLLAD